MQENSYNRIKFSMKIRLNTLKNHANTNARHPKDNT